MWLPPSLDNWKQILQYRSRTSFKTLAFPFRQLLCPALIQLLGSPLTDLNKRPKSVTPFPEEINRGGRGTGSFAKSSSVVGPIPRTIYNIATELLRLVGPLAAMRPVLESLFHRIILYPPAQQRAEALKALKEVQWISWSAHKFSLHCFMDLQQDPILICNEIV